MKVTLSLLGFLLAAYTSALPQDILDGAGGLGIDRRGGNGDPYARVYGSHSSTQDNDNEDWMKQNAERARRSLIARAGANSGDDYNDPSTYSQGYWESIGSDYPKKRSTTASSSSDTPSFDPNDPSTYSQEYWNSIGSDNPKKRAPDAHGDNDPASDTSDPSSYSQEYWNSIGSDFP